MHCALLACRQNDQNAAHRRPSSCLHRVLWPLSSLLLATPPVSDLTDPGPTCGERLAWAPHCWEVSWGWQWLSWLTPVCKALPGHCITSSARSVGSLSPGIYGSRNSQIPVFSTSDKDKPWRSEQYSRYVTHFSCPQSSSPTLRQGVSPGPGSYCVMQGKKAVVVSQGLFWDRFINSLDDKREEGA